MAYTFKRLAEVEEIQEAPETAKAFVEVDGEVKRAPYGAGGGGGANLDELRFDLDVEEIQEGPKYINFTNMEQIKKVLDNDMNIVILYRYPGCGDGQTYYREYHRCNTTAKLSGTSAVIPSFGMLGNGNAYYGYNASNEPITVEFETEERLTPVSAKYQKYSNDYEILAVYATI